MIKQILLFIFSILFLNNLLAQKLPSIQLDRPDQTECPFITPTKYIQVEHGFNIENVNANSKNYSYPTTLWKYGVNEKFELRLITELVTETNNTESVKGFQPITIGFKTTLFEEKGIIPKTSFIGHYTTSKVGSKQFHTKYNSPSFRFTMLHTLSEKASLSYNLGAEWDGENAGQTYIYTLTTGYSLSQKLGCYIELYGFFPNEEKPDHRFDGGFTYLINDDFILDLSGGLGITENASKSYISLGVSYRFKLK